MLLVPVSQKQHVEVIFDPTDGGEMMHTCYIREVTIKIKNLDDRQVQNVSGSLHSLSSLEVAYVHRRDGHEWVIFPRRLNGCTAFTYFQPMVDMQHHQIVKAIETHVPVETIAMTMMIDGVY